MSILSTHSSTSMAICDSTHRGIDVEVGRPSRKQDNEKDPSIVHYENVEPMSSAYVVDPDAERRYVPPYWTTEQS